MKGRKKTLMPDIKRRASIIEPKISWNARAFKSLDSENRGYLLKHELIEHIKAAGTIKHLQVQALLETLAVKGPKDQITFWEFEVMVAGKQFVKRVLENNLVIPSYSCFHANFEKAYNEIQNDIGGVYSGGKLASQIPHMAAADPNSWSSAFCSTDG